MKTIEQIIDEEVLVRESQSKQSLSIPRLLAQYTKKNKNKFYLQNKEIDAYHVYSPEMLLPVVALEAMRLWQSIEKPAHSPKNYDDTLGIVFHESSTAFFPLAAHPALIKPDNILSTLRLLCFNLANRRVFALKENTPINLDAFIEAWKDIDWYSNTIAEIPVPEDYDARFLHEEFTQKRARYDLDVKLNKPEAATTPTHID